MRIVDDGRMLRHAITACGDAVPFDNPNVRHRNRFDTAIQIDESNFYPAPPPSFVIQRPTDRRPRDAPATVFLTPYLLVDSSASIR